MVLNFLRRRLDELVTGLFLLLAAENVHSVASRCHTAASKLCARW